MKFVYILRTAILPVAILASAAANSATLGIVLEPGESASSQATSARYRAFADQVQRDIGDTVWVQYFTNGFTAIKQAKLGNLDMVLGHSQVIANVVKFKYEPIVKSNATISASFVAAPGYKGDLAAKSGARLGVPDYESLVGGVARSEMNRRGLGKADFAEVKVSRSPEAGLLGLEMGRYDMAVVSTEDAKRWVAKHGGRILFTSNPVPVFALAARPGLLTDKAKQKLTASITKGNALNLAASPATVGDFKSVALMLNTTPTAIPGAKTIGAAETKAMIAKGVPIYDVRLNDEYVNGHIPSAISVAYKEISAKVVDFGPQGDVFPLDRLPKDKSAPLIMYCDGTICWKSYKSAIVAMNKGWKNIYWFRGGIPEWIGAGYDLESDNDRSADAQPDRKRG